ncbi:putative exostosin [Helianthus anomalus]
MAGLVHHSCLLKIPRIKYTDSPCGLPKFWIWSLTFQKYTDGPCGLHFIMHLVPNFFQKYMDGPRGLGAGISAKKEAPVNFLTDPLEGRSTLRPADILVFGRVGGKHACVDLTGVSPLVGLESSAFTVGQAALKAASGKVIKHEKACLDNQHVFIQFAFDTFGFLAPKAVDLLSRVQRVMYSNVMTPRSMDVVFKRLSFAIQKGVTAQLVACLPTISM